MSEDGLRVVVVGAGGRMGRQICRAVQEADGLILAGGLEQPEVPLEPGVARLASVDAAAAAGAQVAVDFTHAIAARHNLPQLVSGGIAPVIGTTGLTDDDLAALDRLARDRGVPAFVAANFAIGAVLMMRFAAEAARHFEFAEIVERHHEQKRDAPSGTALRTAAAMRAARGRPFARPPVETTEELPGARGGDDDGLRLHSVRLPGLVADQEVILGGPGETLTISHRTIDRSCFMPGILLAVRRVRELPPGLTVGLETLLFGGAG